MVSMPVLDRVYIKTYPPSSLNPHRHSEEDADALTLMPSPLDTPFPTAWKYCPVRNKQSIKDHLKLRLHSSTFKSSAGESGEISEQFPKRPSLGSNFVNWVREKARNTSLKYSNPLLPSAASSTSDLDPAMTCRGLPSTMMNEGFTVTNTLTNPLPLATSLLTSIPHSEGNIWYPKVRRVSNKHVSGTDSNDESLQRYKQSLGLGGGKDLSDPNDTRVCIIHSLTMESPGRSAVTIDLSAPGSEVTLKDRPFKIKEGCKFTMVATFKVQHEILSGLQYVQVVKRKGIKVSKDSEMLVSIFRIPVFLAYLLLTNHREATPQTQTSNLCTPSAVSNHGDFNFLDAAKLIFA